MAFLLKGGAQGDAWSMATFVRRVVIEARQFICGIHGHEAPLHLDRRHVSLVCLNGGYESPGWNMPGAPAAPGGAAERRQPQASSSRPQRQVTQAA